MRVKQTLDENVKLINRMKANLQSHQEAKVKENLELMQQFRTNIRDVVGG